MAACGNGRLKNGQAKMTFFAAGIALGEIDFPDSAD
jgi:hypothetical protein